jgi:hypothetical protein
MDREVKLNTFGTSRLADNKWTHARLGHFTLKENVAVKNG